MSNLPVIVYIAPLILSMVASLCLGVLFFRHRPGTWAYSLAGTVMAMAVWTLGYLLELLAPSLEQKEFYVCIQYIGITAARYCG